MENFNISSMEKKGERLFIKGNFNNFNEIISFYTFLKWAEDCGFIIETINFNSNFQVDKNEFLEKLTGNSDELSEFIESHKLEALVKEW